MVLVRVESLIAALATPSAAFLQRVPPARATAAHQVSSVQTTLVGVLTAQGDLLAGPFAATGHSAHFSLGKNELKKR